MRLEIVSFDYRLADSVFDYLAYDFAGVPTGADQDGIIAFAKASVGRLEGILDRTYPAFVKTPDGNISSGSLSQGYRFRSEEGGSYAILRYVLDLDLSGRPYNARITLMASDQDQPRLLELHGALVGASQEIAPHARVQIDRIASLRSEPFVVERFLGLKSA
jgi:hypothetical protein